MDRPEAGHSDAEEDEQGYRSCWHIRDWVTQRAQVGRAQGLTCCWARATSLVLKVTRAALKKYVDQPMGRYTWSRGRESLQAV